MEDKNLISLSSPSFSISARRRLAADNLSERWVLSLTMDGKMMMMMMIRRSNIAVFVDVRYATVTLSASQPSCCRV